MKGMLQWVFLTVLITLLLVSFVASPLQQAFDEAIRTSARMHAVRIAGVINLMQTAPDKTRHEYELPDTVCKITIDGNVNVTMTSGKIETSYQEGLLRTSTEVVHRVIECDKEMRKTITFVKDMGRIEIL